MIDSVAIHFPNTCVDIGLLDNKKTYEHWTSGDIGGLRVSSSVAGVMVRGSLPKLLHGTNLFSIGKEEFREALAEIKRVTSLDPIKSRLVSIELGQTFLVSRPCREYLSTWGPLQGRYSINRYDNNQTVAYVNKQRSFQAYDKIAEMKKKGTGGTKRNVNALRLELRISRGLKKVFGRQEQVETFEILETKNWLTLNQLWKDFYFKIPKARDVPLPPKEVFLNELAMGLQIGGIRYYSLERLFNLIDDSQKSGLIDRNRAYKARRRIRRLDAMNFYQDASSLTQELDSLIANYQP